MILHVINALSDCQELIGSILYRILVLEAQQPFCSIRGRDGVSEMGYIYMCVPPTHHNMKDDSKRTYIPLPSQLHPSYHTLINVWSFDTQWNAQLMQNFQLSGDTQDSPST